MIKYLLFTDKRVIKDTFYKIGEAVGLTEVDKNNADELEYVSVIVSDNEKKTLETLVGLAVNSKWNAFRVGTIVLKENEEEIKINLCFTGGAEDIFHNELFSGVMTKETLIWKIIERVGRAQRNEDLRKVKRFFTKIGIYSNLLGYDYLLCAVEKVAENRRYLNNLTTELYPIIAKSFGTNDKNVERNIRNAIEVAYDRGKFHGIANSYGGNFTSYEKPSNGEFIAFIVEEIYL